MAIARRFVLTNASRAKKQKQPKIRKVGLVDGCGSL